MSISSTRKVSSSTGSIRSASVNRTRPSYSSASDGDSFVEVIDTANSISVRDEERDTKDRNRKNFETPEKDSEKSNISNAPNQTYIPSAIEALSASGVYDETQDEPISMNRVNVYGNNQTIIHDEEVERTGHSYLKHFYEKNEIIEEVDELV